MIHFAPNVFVLKYLQKTKQLSHEVESEATDYLVQGNFITLTITSITLYFPINNVPSDKDPSFLVG